MFKIELLKQQLETRKAAIRMRNEGQNKNTNGEKNQGQIQKKINSNEISDRNSTELYFRANSNFGPSLM